MKSTQTFQQVVLKNDRLELVILPEIGCHWPRLRVPIAGQMTDLLYPVEDYDSILSAPSSTGSYIMAPWCNRLPGGRMPFEGAKYHTRINFPDNTAIHGDVRKRPWQVLDATPFLFKARLETAPFTDFNYPFRLIFDHSVFLEQGTLMLHLNITNADTRRAPVGFGYHPFFKRRLFAGRPDPILTLPAEKIFPAKEHMPTGPALPVTGRSDFRGEKRLGSPALDDCFTGLTEHKIRLRYPEDGLEVIFELGPEFQFAVIYIPAKEDGSGHDFFAIEPQTHVTGAFGLMAQGIQNTGLKILAPGETWGASLKIHIQHR